MLVLSRKVGERLIIAGDITVQVLEVRGNRVRLGIEAPPDVTILREELSLGQEPIQEPELVMAGGPNKSR